MIKGKIKHLTIGIRGHNCMFVYASFDWSYPDTANLISTDRIKNVLYAAILDKTLFYNNQIGISEHFSLQSLRYD